MKRCMVCLCLVLPLAAWADREPFQVEVRCELLAIKKADLDQIRIRTPNFTADVDTLHRLLREEKMRVLYSPQVITRSGCNVQIRAGEEIIYPTEFSVEAVTNATGKVATAIIPSAFETRQAGVVLNVTPTVGPDVTLMDLTFVVEFTEDPLWVTYPAKYFDFEGVERTVELKQPVFHSRNISASIVIWNGQTVVAGGGMPSRDGTEVTYALITARILDPGGKPVVK